MFSAFRASIGVLGVNTHADGFVGVFTQSVADHVELGVLLCMDSKEQRRQMEERQDLLHYARS
jgi:hypothetical protein